MKRDLKPGIDIHRCNAYSAIAYMCAAIDVKGRPVFATNSEGRSDLNAPDDKKGGIIVFAQEENVAQLSKDKLKEWFKHTSLSSLNWTIGNFCKGRCTGIKGKVYSDDSLSVEITGVSDEELISIGKELCRTFKQQPVLIKVYSEWNRILVVSGE